MGSESLLRVAQRLSKILGGTTVLIGGVAVSAWGHVRATDDVDFAATGEPEELVSRLGAAGIPAELVRAGDLREPSQWAIRGTVGETPFRVISAPVPIDLAAAIEVRDGRDVVRVVALRDLIRLELCAAGMHDLWDVAKLLRLYPDETEWAASQAERFGVAAELDRWLRDPRLG